MWSNSSSTYKFHTKNPKAGGNQWLPPAFFALFNPVFGKESLFSGAFAPLFAEKSNFWNSGKSAKKLLIFYKKCFIIGVCGEKCTKVEQCGEFPQFPQSFPQPGGAVDFTHQNDCKRR